MYGTDDRTDVYAHPDADLRALAQRSIVALVRARRVDASDPNNVTLSSRTLGEEESLCRGERFADDPTASYCSGTLIDDDLVLTAGHCVESAAECADTRLVFNYYRDSATTLARVTSLDVFQCAAVVTSRNETLADGTELDYEILRIDRSAAPRFQPATVRRRGGVTLGQRLAVIGFGSGIPAKIDSGGRVTDARVGFTDYFDANTDTFGGSSGAGVFDLSSRALVGILVRGATDYVDRGGCNVVNTCPDAPGPADCDGESVSHVERALDDFCASNSAPRLCSRDDAGADAASADASDSDVDDSAAAPTRDAALADAPHADVADDERAPTIADSATRDASAADAAPSFVLTGGCQCGVRPARTSGGPLALSLSLLAFAAARLGRKAKRGR